MGAEAGIFNHSPVLIAFLVATRSKLFVRCHSVRRPRTQAPRPFEPERKVFGRQARDLTPGHQTLCRIARFPLVTNGEHQYNVLPLLITIERHIATLAIRDQEFPQSLLTWSADKRMSLKNLCSVANYIDRCDSSLWCVLDEKVGESLQVGKRVSRVDYFRHVRTFGRFARSPRTRAAK